MIIVKKFKPHPPMMADRGGEAGSFEPYRNRYRVGLGWVVGKGFQGTGGTVGRLQQARSSLNARAMIARVHKPRAMA